ncbi:hypothetical protein ACFJIW_12070 [Tahibacter sp. UC22_41]|uniref:hypothetical protein n=1 Tax=Tahibacter sp. UC22_41 TaxID=3350178 RepID=UPI0036D8871C
MSWILLVLAVIALVVVHQGRIADAKRARKAADEAKRAADAVAQRFQQQIGALNRELLSLRPFECVRDAMAATAVLREEGRRMLVKAAKDANAMRAAAQAKAGQVRSQAAVAANALKLDAKTSHADAQTKIATPIESANKRAETLIADVEARVSKASKR